MEKNDDGLGTLLWVIILFIVIGTVFSPDEQPEQGANKNQPPSWEEYRISPAEGDILTQLQNTQNLVIALEGDIAQIEAQGVGLQLALETVKNQLSTAQRQAAEEGRRQRVEQWITGIGGLFFGWILGAYPPTPKNIQSLKAWLDGIGKKNGYTRGKAYSDQQRKGVGLLGVLLLVFIICIIADIVVFFQVIR